MFSHRWVFEKSFSGPSCWREKGFEVEDTQGSTVEVEMSFWKIRKVTLEGKLVSQNDDASVSFEEVLNLFFHLRSTVAFEHTDRAQ